MNTPTYAVTRFAALIQSTAGASEESVIAALKKATPAELRKVKTTAGAMGVYLRYSDVPVETKMHLGLTMVLTTRVTGGSPAMDLSELADEVEAANHQANLETIQELEKAPHVGEIKLREMQVGDRAELLRDLSALEQGQVVKLAGVVGKGFLLESLDGRKTGYATSKHLKLAA